MEYLVTMTTRVPAGTPEQALPDVRAREAARASEPAPRGTSAAVAFAAAPGQERAREPAGQATGR
jgi:muconolactone delta-isomerase